MHLTHHPLLSLQTFPLSLPALSLFPDDIQPLGWCPRPGCMGPSPSPGQLGWPQSPCEPPPGCPPPHGGSAPRGARFPAPPAQHAPTKVLTTFCCAFQLLRLCTSALPPLLSGRFRPPPRPKPRLCQPPPIPTPLQGAVPETQDPTVPSPWLVVINAA